MICLARPPIPPAMTTPFTAVAITHPDEAHFLAHWAPRYTDDDAPYERHIGRPLTEDGLWALFRWKNGGGIAPLKQASIRRNYPLDPPPDPEGRYLDERRPGGPIWNIFYLHCLDHARWPIYDQHAHRAMVWIQENRIDELPNGGARATKRAIYACYRERFVPFIRGFAETDRRRVDRALFAFGRFLKRVAGQIQPTGVSGRVP